MMKAAAASWISTVTSQNYFYEQLTVLISKIWMVHDEIKNIDDRPEILLYNMLCWCDVCRTVNLLPAGAGWVFNGCFVGLGLNYDG